MERDAVGEERRNRRKGGGGGRSCLAGAAGALWPGAFCWGGCGMFVAHGLSGQRVFAHQIPRYAPIVNSALLKQRENHHHRNNSRRYAEAV